MWDILKIVALTTYLAGGSVFNVVFWVHEPKDAWSFPHLAHITVIFIKFAIAVMCPN
jgi:hypothetical protein